MVTTTSPIDATAPDAQSSPQVRVGAVRYLNTVPLIASLDKASGLQFRLEPPARLIDLLAAVGPDAAPEVDLALCSIIDYQRSPIPLEIVAVGAIACDGPTRTVRLFSRVPFAEVRTLHADIESHTSVALAAVILSALHNVQPTVAPLDFSAGPARVWPDTVLLIGDKTMSNPPPASTHPHRIDLGAAWRELTGLPFVYAAWMCRAGEYDARPELRRAAALLDRQRRRNAHRLGWLAFNAAPTHAWAPAEALDYTAHELRYELDDAMRAAITHFFARVQALGLIKGQAPLRWAGESAHADE